MNTPFATRSLDLWSLTNGHRLPDGVSLDTDLRDSMGRAMTIKSLIQQIQPLRTAMPDHRVWVEACIGDISHALLRLRHRGTHSAESTFGPPSLAQVQFASALAIELNEGTLTSAQMIIDQSPLLGNAPAQFGERFPMAAPRPEDQGTPVGEMGTWAEVYADFLIAAMEGDFSLLARGSDPALEVQAPALHDHGPEASVQFWLGLRGAVPNAQFRVHQGHSTEQALSSPSAAVAWSLCGDHLGWGRYGAPSGAPLVIRGMCFAEFGQKGLRRTWIVLDDAAVWRQIQAFKISSCPANA